MWCGRRWLEYGNSVLSAYNHQWKLQSLNCTLRTSSALVGAVFYVNEVIAECSNGGVNLRNPFFELQHRRIKGSRQELPLGRLSDGKSFADLAKELTDVNLKVRDRYRHEERPLRKG